jgi:hypothetical protein
VLISARVSWYYVDVADQAALKIEHGCVLGLRLLKLFEREFRNREIF